MIYYVSILAPSIGFSSRKVARSSKMPVVTRIPIPTRPSTVSDNDHVSRTNQLIDAVTSASISSVVTTILPETLYQQERNRKLALINSGIFNNSPIISNTNGILAPAYSYSYSYAPSPTSSPPIIVSIRSKEVNGRLLNDGKINS